MRLSRRRSPGHAVGLAYCLFLIGCSSSQPNHLGNPLLWPIQGIQSAFENRSYEARKAKVRRQAVAHFETIEYEVFRGGGPQLSTAMKLALVVPAQQSNLIGELQQNRSLYFSGDPEPLVVALMVHGGQPSP